MDLTGLTFNTADVFAVAALVLAGYAAIWGIKLVIGMAKKQFILQPGKGGAIQFPPFF